MRKHLLIINDKFPLFFYRTKINTIPYKYFQIYTKKYFFARLAEFVACCTKK